MGKTIDLTTGNLKINIVRFAIPVMLSGILQLLFSQADIIVCNFFGSEYSVGAINATSPFTNLILNILIGFSVGANVCISNAVGAKLKENAERIIGTSLILGLVCSVVLGALGVIITRPVLELMGTPAECIDLSTQYLQIYFCGVPFIILYDFAAALLRGMGDSKRPFYFLTLAGVLNVALNLVFVICFDMDVSGVALATTLTQGVAAFLSIYVLFKGHLFANFHWKYFRFKKKEVVSIIKVGIPAGIQSSFFSISNLIIQSSINSFGANAVTGSGAGAQIESYLNTIQNCFGQACIAFVAANYGSHNIKNIKTAIKWCLIYASSVTVVTSLVAVLARDQLLSLFLNSDNAEALKVGSTRVLINCGLYITYVFTDCPPYAERGLKYSLIPTIISLLGICGSRLLFIFTLFRMEQFHSMDWLFYTYPISWALTGAAHLVALLYMYRKTKEKILSGASLAAESK